MIPINCLIVDDDEMDRMNIEDYVTHCSDLKLLGSFSNPVESMELLKTQKIDLLFLDIDMPVMDGISFLKKIENPPLCIYVTSFRDYAADAYDAHAVDYLLKPVKQERFDEAIKRIKEILVLNKKAQYYDLHFEDGQVTIRVGNAIHKVLISDIIFLEALANWTKVVASGQKYITLYNLKNFLQELPRDKFLRVHRSYAVAKNKINKLQNNELHLGEHNVPVGKTYRQSVLNFLSQKDQ